MNKNFGKGNFPKTGNIPVPNSRSPENPYDASSPSKLIVRVESYRITNHLGILSV